MDETQPLLSSTSTLNNHVSDPDHDAVYDKVVDFNPEGDPDNPMEWPQPYKRGVIMLLAFMAFTV
jgi:hypothetical protein